MAAQELTQVPAPKSAEALVREQYPFFFEPKVQIIAATDPKFPVELYNGYDAIIVVPNPHASYLDGRKHSPNMILLWKDGQILREKRMVAIDSHDVCTEQKYHLSKFDEQIANVIATAYRLLFANNRVEYLYFYCRIEGEYQYLWYDMTAQAFRSFTSNLILPVNHQRLIEHIDADVTTGNIHGIYAHATNQVQTVITYSNLSGDALLQIARALMPRPEVQVSKTKTTKIRKSRKTKVAVDSTVQAATALAEEEPMADPVQVTEVEDVLPIQANRVVVSMDTEVVEPEELIFNSDETQNEFDQSQPEENLVADEPLPQTESAGAIVPYNQITFVLPESEPVVEPSDSHDVIVLKNVDVQVLPQPEMEFEEPEQDDELVDEEPSLNKLLDLLENNNFTAADYAECHGWLIQEITSNNLSAAELRGLASIVNKWSIRSRDREESRLRNEAHRALLVDLYIYAEQKQENRDFAELISYLKRFGPVETYIREQQAAAEAAAKESQDDEFELSVERLVELLNSPAFNVQDFEEWHKWLQDQLEQEMLFAQEIRQLMEAISAWKKLAPKQEQAERSDIRRDLLVKLYEYCRTEAENAEFSQDYGKLVQELSEMGPVISYIKEQNKANFVAKELSNQPEQSHEDESKEQQDKEGVRVSIQELTAHFRDRTFTAAKFSSQGWLESFLALLNDTDHVVDERDLRGLRNTMFHEWIKNTKGSEGAARSKKNAEVLVLIYEYCIRNNYAKEVEDMKRVPAIRDYLKNDNR